MIVLINASGSCLLIPGKWRPRNNEIFGWIYLKRSDFSAPDMSPPYFSRRIVWVDIMAEYYVRKTKIQGLLGRLSITLNMSLKMTPLKVSRINIKMYWKTKTWHHLRRITKESTINAGCTTPDGSTAAQPGTLTSVASNRLCDFPWTWKPN